MKYLITYDLKKVWGRNIDRDYENLYAKIKTYPHAVRATESSWIVVSNNSADYIKRDLARVMYTTDSIFVCSLGYDYSCSNCYDGDYYVNNTMNY